MAIRYLGCPFAARAATILRALGIILFSISVAQASERVTVCAKYETQLGWSKAYQVQATVATGSELNQATHTFGYTAYAKYVVIFWAENEASVIELDLPFLSVVGQTGKDQRGRRWQVSTGGLCY